MRLRGLAGDTRSRYVHAESGDGSRGDEGDCAFATAELEDDALRVWAVSEAETAAPARRRNEVRHDDSRRIREVADVARSAPGGVFGPWHRTALAAPRSPDESLTLRREVDQDDKRSRRELSRNAATSVAHRTRHRLSKAPVGALPFTLRTRRECSSAKRGDEWQATPSPRRSSASSASPTSASDTGSTPQRSSVGSGPASSPRRSTSSAAPAGASPRSRRGRLTNIGTVPPAKSRNLRNQGAPVIRPIFVRDLRSCGFGLLPEPHAPGQAHP